MPQMQGQPETGAITWVFAYSVQDFNLKVKQTP